MENQVECFIKNVSTMYVPVEEISKIKEKLSDVIKYFELGEKLRELTSDKGHYPFAIQNIQSVLDGFKKVIYTLDFKNRFTAQEIADSVCKEG